MDWGLFRTKEAGKYGLRKKLKFKPNFYYFAMGANFFLRFFWIFSIINWPYITNQSLFAHRFQTMSFLSMFAEGIRRTLWALIRVENEFYNNFE